MKFSITGENLIRCLHEYFSSVNDLEDPPGFRFDFCRNFCFSGATRSFFSVWEAQVELQLNADIAEIYLFSCNGEKRSAVLLLLRNKFVCKLLCFSFANTKTVHLGFFISSLFSFDVKQTRGSFLSKCRTPFTTQAR